CFDRIRCENGVVSFEVIDGRYTVIYAPNSSAKELYDGEKETKVKKINDIWYHKKSGCSSFWEVLKVITGISYIELLWED
ncbi:MAG: hypothetical protein NC110_05415, partial [Ruminococcus sp.]|nr:hypothetical protein [Ruminococcus sp.]